MARDTILLQMAMGIAGDLGLNRAVEDQVVPARSIADEAPVQVIGFNLRREPTNAGRRAFLAIFYLTSTYVRTWEKKIKKSHLILVQSDKISF